MAIPQTAMDLQTKVQKIVLAGMKLMYSPAMLKTLIEGMSSNLPMPQKLAMEVSGVLKIVDDKSPRGLPPDAVAPAAVMLLFDMALFMKESGAGNPTQEDIQGAIRIMQKVLVDAFAKGGKAMQQRPAQQQPQGLLAQPAPQQTGV